MQLTRDDTFSVVLNIRTPNGPSSEEVGTGIFIATNDNKPYILTASHVAKTCNANTVIVISDNQSNSISIPLIQLNNSPQWRHHPIADMSVLQVIPDPTISYHLQGRFFPLSQFNTTTTTPSRDSYLTSVGFPHGLGAIGKFSPFTFRSHASSGLISLNRFDTKTPCDFFILENPSIGGYSGGPIFDLGYVIVGSMRTSTGNTICHGIMHGTISDATGGKIAAVTPSYYVSQLI